MNSISTALNLKNEWLKKRFINRIPDNANFAEINKITTSKEQINISKSLAREFGARKLIPFGRGLEETGSFNDIDLACDGIAGWKLYEFGARLEEFLAISVDLVAPICCHTPFYKAKSNPLPKSAAFRKILA